MESKYEVLTKLNDLNYSHSLPINTSDLSQQVNLSRSVTSHYLNQLLEDGLVVKLEGRPVLWNLTESKTNKKILPFNDFIGSNGSLKNVVSQC